MKTRYDLAAEKAREAIEELRLAAYEQGYKDATHDLTAKAPVSKSPQDIRDEIIEKAKRDVAKIVNDESFQYTFRYKNHSGNDLLGGTSAKVEFVVNSEKRTVVSLIKSYFMKNQVLSRGIAKCDPSDCFNVHIGKAIALRRALGLEVPAEYMNAPQPMEVRVGDIVRWVPEYSFRVGESHIICVENGSRFGKKDLEYAKIVDDSRE
jgi:hypothetical protein